MTDWVSEILQRHRSILSRAQAAEAELHVSYGDAWLAAYGLFQDGYEDGWLTEQDLREAIELARKNVFSHFSASVEKVATQRLRTLTVADTASNATDWASEIVSRHADVLNRVQVEETEAYIADGDGWLAAYDLFQDGFKDGWLTEQDLREALDLATRKMFSKLSGNVEKKASDRLSALCLDPLV